MQDTKYLLDPERKKQLMQLVVAAYAQQVEKEHAEAYAEPMTDKPASKRGLLATARQGGFQAPLTEQQKKNREAIKVLMQGKQPSNKEKE